ncbi:MAG: hypothetical protein IH840_05210 [Candidatus Heimdallarchaeota archaeon]|nr:hypothetical protein [Candidatus Heimdallarchaeota archaeon]
MSNRQSTKLIFAGLDKAGKTTIYKATMEEMDTQELGDIAPTRGIERHAHDFLDRDFSVWDLGGQQNYRQAYLEKPEVFNQTKALIFVVDIQDMDRIQESYEYFTDILNILKNVDPAPSLYVLFHKYDPEIAGKLKAHFYQAARLYRKADSLTKQKFKFYLTSIYSNSVDLAVKRMLFENFENFEEPSGRLVTKQKTPEGEVSEDKVPVPLSPASSTPVPGTPDRSAAPAPAPKPTPRTDEQAIPQPTSAMSVAPSLTPAESSIPAPSSREPPSISTPQVSEETLSEEAAVEQATPKDLVDLSDNVVEKLTEIVNRRMKESEEIVALSIISTSGEQKLAVGKSEVDYDRLGTLKEVVMTLNPKQFFKNLADIEYRCLGHFSLSDFDIYFARVSDEYAIAIIATDVSTMMLQNAQRIVRSVRQGLGMVPADTGDDDDDEEDGGPKTTKKDLVSDLRSRLKSLSSLSDLN